MDEVQQRTNPIDIRMLAVLYITFIYSFDARCHLHRRLTDNVTYNMPLVYKLLEG